MSKFRADCAAGLPIDWRQGQIDYPRTLDTTVGEPVIYEAAIDVREGRPPADHVITVDNGSAATKQVAVKCRLGAKLTPSSNNLEVNPDDTEWAYRDFSATGFVQWAWAVTPTKPVDQKLTLVVRPAVDLSTAEGTPSSSYGVGANTEVRFFTNIAVSGTLIERISYWFETQWTLVVVIAGAVAVGVTAFLTWWSKTRRQLRGNSRTDGGADSQQGG